jgi:hypothetical protein
MSPLVTCSFRRLEFDARAAKYPFEADETSMLAPLPETPSSLLKDDV